MPRINFGLIVWALVPPLFLILSNGNFFLSTVVYFVVPGIYFSLRIPKVISRATVVGLATLPFVLVLDYLAFANNAWVVPSIFHYRVLSLVPLEDFWWTFWALYTVVIGYSYFFDRKNSGNIHTSRVIRFFLLATLSLVIFFCIYTIHPSSFVFSYYYLKMMLVVFVLIPIVVSLHYRPAYLRNVLKVSAYSFCVMILYELTALYLGFWAFPPADYVAIIHVNQQLILPVEELFTWVILFPHAALALAEFVSGGRVAAYSANEISYAVRKSTFSREPRAQ